MKRLSPIYLIFILLTTLPVAAKLQQLDCDKVVDYKINAKLDILEKTIIGEQYLTWRNTTLKPTAELYFHAYLNAFKNNKSTFARGYVKNHEDDYLNDRPKAYHGYLDLKAVELLPGDQPGGGLVPTITFVQPDDKNADDETVFKIILPQPVPSGQTVTLKFNFITKLPQKVPRSGYKGDYFMVAQWFPKIGVLEQNGWNCHQYHRHSEFFANYGSYDVRITIPVGFIVGATGVVQDSTGNNDGTYTVHYRQDCIHDFAWTASPNFLVKTATFTMENFPPVEIKLLLQPEHKQFADAYIDACTATLKYYGLWYGPYPYPKLTIVDPVWDSWTGGMEYPTLFTGAVSWQVPASILAPHGITIHEAGHQWWYGLVGNNEFESAWLDEGFNSYSTARCLLTAFGAPRAFKSYFRYTLAFPGAIVDPRYELLTEYQQSFANDVVDQFTWLYQDGPSYRANVYGKGALVLWTMEGYLGEEVFSTILKTYASRYRFNHPKTQDFIQVANEMVSENMDWFFNQVLYTSDVLDYEVAEIKNQVENPARGFFTRDSTLVYQDEKPGDEKKKQYLSEVTVQRPGNVIIPVDILITFANGEEIRETWDGKARWHRFTYRTDQKISSVVLDPERKLWLDINYQNNTLFSEKKNLSAVKWTFKWMFWLQHLMEVFSFFS